MTCLKRKMANTRMLVGREFSIIMSKIYESECLGYCSRFLYIPPRILAETKRKNFESIITLF
jgi:hypothetical protein